MNLKMSDDDFVTDSKVQSQQNRKDMSYFIVEVIRYGYSDRGAAALWNAALKSVGLIVDGINKQATDKSKIRRARETFGAKQKLEKKAKVYATGGLKCIGSDLKRNKKTKQKELQVMNNCVVTKSQEHIVYTQEPPGSYLQHSEIAPHKGTGQDLVCSP